MRKDSGFGLTLLVALIAIAGVMLGGSTLFFTNAMRQTQLRIDQTRAQYLAQAGVMRAVWDWYVSNTATETSRRWSPISTTVTGNLKFKAGSDSAGARLHSNYAWYSSTSDPIISYVKNVGTATDHALSNTSIQILTPVAGVAQGDYLVVYGALDANGVTPLCSDARGNPYSNPPRVNISAGNTNATPRLVVCTAPVNTALVNGDYIRMSWTNNVLAEAISVSQFTNVDDVLDVAVATATGSNANPTTGNISTSYRDVLLIGGIAAEGPGSGGTPDSFTAGANYTTSPPTRAGTAHATAASNSTIDPEYRIVNATGSYLANGTITSRDWSAGIVPMRAVTRWVTSGGTNRRLRLWQIYNINNGNSITLTHMKVSWTGGGAARLTEIQLNNSSVWTGTGSTGGLIDITDTAIANGGTIGGVNTWLQWNNSGPADPVTVTCQFTFSGDSSTTDAKSPEIVLWDGAQAAAGLPTKKIFTVTATGKVDQTTGTAFPVMKTVKATVSSAPGASAFEIIDWDEGDKSIP